MTALAPDWAFEEDSACVMMDVGDELVVEVEVGIDGETRKERVGR